jgi:hypothetical protein
VLADSSTGNRKFVILEYELINTTSQTFNNVVAGIFADWDLISAGQNGCGYDPITRIGFVNTLPDTLIGGVQLLNFENANFYAIDNVPGGNGGYNLYDGFTNAEKNQVMRNIRLNTGAGTNGTDVIITLASPTFNLAPSDTQTVAFALISGNSLEEIQATGNTAESFYQNQGVPLVLKNNKTPKPSVFPNPSQDQFQIQGLLTNEQIYFRLINSSGLEISSGWINPTDAISTKNCSSGIYILSIQTETEITHQQILIIKP